MKKIVKEHWFTSLMLLSVMVGVVSGWAFAIANTHKVEMPRTSYSVIHSDKLIEGTVTEETSTITTTTTTTQKNVYYDCPLDENYQDYLTDICKSYGVPVPLVLAIMEHESGFDFNACGTNTNGSQDCGIMQINSRNHEWLKGVLGVSDIMDKYDNALCGVYIIHQAIDYADGDIQLALMCYNCGCGGASSLLADGVYSTSYSRTVYQTYEYYKEATL